jgi:hypothetical protein
MKRADKIGGLALLVVSVVLVTMATYGIGQYLTAGYCQSSNTNSKTCVSRSDAVVVRQLSRDVAGGNEAPNIVHGVVLEYSGGTCDLWLGDMSSRLVPQAKVSLRRWNGHCIGVNESGKIQYGYYWKPSVVIFFIVFVLSTLVLATPLAWQRVRRSMATKAGRIYVTCLIAATIFSVAWVVLLVPVNASMGFL